MELSLVVQINLIGFSLVAIVYLMLGHKLARLLMPFCGMLVLEGLMYLLISVPFEDNEVLRALFYCLSAIAIYLGLFFLPRVAAFFVGLVGSLLFMCLVVLAFSLENITLITPICLTVGVMVGLISAVFKRNGVVVATSLFGGCISVILIAFLFLAPAANIGGLSALQGVISILGNNGYMLIGLSGAAIAIGLYLQLRFTAYNQVLERKRKKTATKQESFV